MSQVTRRDFLRTGLAGTLLAGAGGVTAFAQKRSATDWVTLGKSGVQVTRLARGLPAGSSIEYANKNILSDAIAGRQRM